MNVGECRLISLAAALIADSAKLSTAEANLLANGSSVDSHLIAHARAQILAGDDLLGNMFCALRSARERRQRGATYTPAAIVDAMVEWAHAEIPAPARVIDPGAGSGRFLIAAARKFPETELIAVDVDPLAALMLRANAAVHGFAERLAVHLIDYRDFALPTIRGPTLFIGNPPYVRHHNIRAGSPRRPSATVSRPASLLACTSISFSRHKNLRRGAIMALSSQPRNGSM
jgi:type I restriction-modification system DNA methylase subunit